MWCFMQEYSALVDIIGNIGALGFVLVLFWHTTSHTIPKLTRSFEESTKTARQDFRDMLKTQRDDFREMLKDHRKFVVQLGTKEN